MPSTLLSNPPYYPRPDDVDLELEYLSASQLLDLSAPGYLGLDLDLALEQAQEYHGAAALCKADLGANGKVGRVTVVECRDAGLDCKTHFDHREDVHETTELFLQKQDPSIVTVTLPPTPAASPPTVSTAPVAVAVAVASAVVTADEPKRWVARILEKDISSPLVLRKDELDDGPAATTKVKKTTYREWTRLQREGIEATDVLLTKGEEKILVDPKLGAFRSYRPSTLRRAWSNKT